MKRTAVFKMGAGLYLAATLLQMAAAAPSRLVRPAPRAPSLVASFRHRHPVNAVAMAGALLAAGGGYSGASGVRGEGADNVSLGEVRLYDARRGRLLRSLSGLDGEVNGLALTPDARRLVTAGNTLVFWDAASGRRLRAFPADDSLYVAVASSPDGRLLAAGREGGTVELRDSRSGALARTLRTAGGTIGALQFSPDSRLLAGFADLSDNDHPAGATTVWNVATGLVAVPLTLRDEQVRSVAFSPDSRLLATGGDVVRLWDALSGTPVRTLRGSEGAGLVAAAGGGFLAAAGDRDGVLLWETKSWRLRHRLSAHNSRLTALALSPDGHRLAAGSRDGIVRLWGLASGMPTRR